jgi:hypothetical protein
MPRPTPILPSRPRRGTTRTLRVNRAPVRLERAPQPVGAGRLAVLRHELYAVPALLGAGVVVGVHAAGSLGPAFPVVGACLCFLTRMIGVRYGIDAPAAPSERRRRRSE